MDSRSSGIVMHISSLPGKYGIGDFGQEAYDFVDYLVKAKQKNWQILPLGITSFGDSPYQSFSAFAGNPYFIDLDEMLEKQFISQKDLIKYKLDIDENKVHYDNLYLNKMKLLRIAYDKSKIVLHEKLKEFYDSNFDWLRNFGLFMAIKYKHDNKSWHEWDKNYREIDSEVVLDFEKTNQDEIFFWVFTQYFFYKHWNKLKKYCNEMGVKIIGDLPIYVSEDSSDLWSNPEYFNVDKNFMPLTVSGCPPDGFADDGQLWGNPIYNWKAMEDDGYKWWIKRIAHSFEIFDTVRIDHFRGFESYWEVDYGDKTARGGKWIKGPGINLFNKIKDKLGDLDIIVEDLGFNTPEVTKMVEDSGYPNMKVLHYAFNPYAESEHAPHGFDKNCIVYTSTHDTQTLMGWFDTLPKDIFEYAAKYFKLCHTEGLNWGVIRGAWGSSANLAMTTMQDLIGLDDCGRMNTPGVMENNWTWRVKKEQMTDEIANRLANITKMYWR